MRVLCFVLLEISRAREVVSVRSSVSLKSGLEIEYLSKRSLNRFERRTWCTRSRVITCRMRAVLVLVWFCYGDRVGSIYKGTERVEAGCPRLSTTHHSKQGNLKRTRHPPITRLLPLNSTWPAQSKLPANLLEVRRRRSPPSTSPNLSLRQGAPQAARCQVCCPQDCSPSPPFLSIAFCSNCHVDCDWWCQEASSLQARYRRSS